MSRVGAAALLERNVRRMDATAAARFLGGKTVIASTAMDELTRELASGAAECNYGSVAWVWIAPNKLHQQSYRSMRNFFSETRSLRPIWFDEAEVSEGLQPGEVLFLNWER